MVIMHCFQQLIYCTVTDTTCSYWVSTASGGKALAGALGWLLLSLHKSDSVFNLLQNNLRL